MKYRGVVLFGGSFDPVHHGHLTMAAFAMDYVQADRLIFIPASRSPHKTASPTATGQQRMEMIRLAIADNPHFSVSEVELQRPGKSYSVETVTYFRQQFGFATPLYFILGLDAFREIDTWKEYAALFGLCHFIIMTRPGSGKNFSPAYLPVELAGNFCYDNQKGGYVHGSGFAVFPKEITALDISSTRIRENLQKGFSIRYLLPSAVEDFIYRNGLYQTKDIESIG